MTQVALVSSEAIRPSMGGIGVRYLEFARRLPAAGFEVRLLSPGLPEAAAACGLDGVVVDTLRRGALAAQLADCDVVIAQGQHANDVLVEMPRLPAVIDLYDPWLVENLHYAAELGLDPYRNDHATWWLQLSRGDYFLCSSAEQRLYYLGFLTALGRVHPELLAADPEAAGLIGIVPFGIDLHAGGQSPLLPERRPGERRLLFGGLYDWYDPWVVLAALERLDDPDVVLLVVRNPNPDATPQRLFAEVEAWCRTRGWWGERVRPIDWVPAARRHDLLADVDALVATHRPGLETDLAMRTRFLDALAIGCPCVSTAGGTVARLLQTQEAGWVVSPGAPDELAAALRAVLAGGDPVARRIANGRQVAEQFAWERVLEPLVAFLKAPRVDPSKERFGLQGAARTPPDPWAFRLRRWLGRRLGGRR